MLIQKCDWKQLRKKSNLLLANKDKRRKMKDESTVEYKQVVIDAPNLQIYKLSSLARAKTMDRGSFR